MPSRDWQVHEFDARVARSLTDSLSLPPLIGRLLAQRGISDCGAVDRFLNPSLEQLHDPFRLTDFTKTTDRLIAAIQKKERIVVHGDFDVDGVTSTVMVSRLLELLGANVCYYIPNRLSDGHGLRPESVELLSDEGVQVIVSVDCGIQSVEAADRAALLGIDLIVTDHHEPGPKLPNAFSIINPRLAGSNYPEMNLSGAGVAFKLVQGLCQRTGHEPWLSGFVKLAAIGTVADVVPLQGENRVIVKLGLEQLSSGPNSVGLDALIDVAGLVGKSIDSENVAFGLVPRLNAAGRMASADLAARLLFTTDTARRNEAFILARKLDELNTQRQKVQRDVFMKAQEMIEADSKIKSHEVMVVAGVGWHRGVIGIVASKLVEMSEKPTIVLSIEGDVAHGSGRSTPDFDLLGALNRCSHLFTQFGGHRMAAGVTLEATKISALQESLNMYGDKGLREGHETAILHIDAPLEIKELNTELISGINRLKPFGRGNPKPVFQANGVKMVERPKLLNNQHLAMSLNQDGHVFRAIAWRSAHRKDFLQGLGDEIDVVYSLMENHFKGKSTVQLSIADVREAR